MAGAKRTIVKRVIVGTPIRSVRQSGSDLNFAGDSGTDTVAVGTAQVLTFTGTDPVQTAVTNNRVTISLDTATGQRTGIAKFDSDHFSVDVTGNVRLNVLDSSDQVTHSLIPNADSALDLGSATNKWRKLYLSGQTIQLGTIALEESDGGFAVKTASGDPAALSLAGNTTTDLTEGDNLYYTRARFDSALGDTLSTGTIRGYIQVLDQGGDGSLSYDSATGNITYTGPSATEVRAHFQAIDAGGDGTFTYDSATGTFTYTGLSVSQARGYFQVLDQGGDGSLSYDSATGNFTYTGPSATEVRAHLVSGTGVIYDSANGVISIGQDVSTISNVTFNNITAQNDVYISGNLTVQGSQTYVNSTIVTINDRNIVLADSAVNGADIDEGGITLGGALFTGVAPTFTYGLANDRWETNKNLNVGGAGNISADSATFNTITRSNATTIAGTYGSASAVPVLTVDASGFIDSIGSTTIGGLSSVTWDSATDKLTIGATDGSTYIAIINGFNHLEADSASFNTINVGTAYNISQLSVDSAHIGIIDNDTARINSLQADSASVTNISGTSANYSTVNATTGTISQLDVDSAHIQTLNTHTLTRSNTTVTAGSYGSASLVPVLTVDASGFVDSIGTVSVAGVSSTSWDSSVGVFTINTADGGTYATPIRGFGDNVSLAFGDNDDAIINRNPVNLIIKDSTGGIYIEAQDIYLSSKNNGNPIWLQAGADDGVKINDSSGDLRLQTVSTGIKVYGSLTGATTVSSTNLEADSADIQIISGSIASYGSLLGDSATISQLSVDSAHIGIIDNNTLNTNALNADSAIATNISGVSLNYGTGHISQLTVDSATITSFQADSATVGEIQFQLGWADSHIGFREGALWYDPFHKNLNYYTDFDHPIEIGMQEVERVYNNTGVEIAKGKPLYYSGNFVNDSGRESPTIALADATDAAKYNVQGLSAAAIPNNSYGQIVVSGVIDGIDTSSLTAGQNFFAGLTPGALQNAAPAYPNFPMCLGWVIKSDPNNGKVIINQQNHSVSGFRVQSAAHIGGDLTIDGNLNVTGTQTITSTANVEIGGNFQYLNAGNTIGEAGTSFVGTGLDDAFFSGHYSGDSASKSFFVKIDATGTPDTFEWGFDSAVGTEATGIAITGAAQILDSAYGIEIDFGATTGHTVGDKWTGTATKSDIDTGFFSNRNDSAYTHVGLYFDVSENKWTFLNRYDPEPEAPIDPSAAGTQYGVVKATTFEGGLSGNVTGNVTGSLTGNADTATTLATGRNFSASGDATAPNVSFNGSAPVDLVLTLATVNSNVGSFGSSSAVPAITVNAKGLVTAVTATNIDHDALTNFVSNEHIDHTSVSITAGTGLTGGGTIASTRDLAIDSAEFLAYFESSINHDNLTGFVADEHIAHSTVSITAGTGLTGGGTIAATRDLSIDSAELLAYYESSLRHDNLSGFVANEHIDHTSVSITAGTGLTGGGDITSTRDLAIDSAELNAYFGGSGKGFDADTLDGQEGTYYRINVYDAAGSLLN